MRPPYYADGSATVFHGDCIEVMREIPAASVDAVVTDPPYGLEFMGKDWDAPWKVGERGDDAAFIGVGYTDGATRLARPTYTGNPNTSCLNCGGSRRGQVTDQGPKRCRCDDPSFPNIAAIQGREFGRWCEQWTAECLRVLKPGGYLLAFGGSRTWHRLACAVEDAGFEVRDSIAWLYGSGFPKSLDVSKAIDKAAGAEREVVGIKSGRGAAPRNDMRGGQYGSAPANLIDTSAITAPATPAAQTWQGWGTALKPAFEPIVVARKPLVGTVAANVLAHGTGALNIDGCRVSATDSLVRPPIRREDNDVLGKGLGTGTQTEPSGRWPANVILDDSQAAELDRQSGILASGSRKPGTYKGLGYTGSESADFPAIDGDFGGASRFFPTFHYEAKAPTDERPRVDGVAHPTVKPLDLMRWLVRLVTPPGGTVLEPFAGSGTTAEACVIEGLKCIAIEREAAYLPLITARLSKPIQVGLDLGATA